MQYTIEETVKLLESRIKASKECYKNYQRLYKEHCEVYDLELAERYYRYMHQELAVLTELKSIYKTITGKEY